MTETNKTRRSTRRSVLAAVGSGAATALAGCSSGGGDAGGANGSSENTTTQSSTSAAQSGHPTNGWYRDAHDAGGTRFTEGPVPTGEFERAWQIERDEPFAVSAADGDQLYIAPGETLEAISYDGVSKWDRPLEWYNGVQVDDGTLTYYNEGTAYRIDTADGSRRSATEIPKWNETTSRLLVGDPNMVTGADGGLKLIDLSTGEERWQRDVACNTPVRATDDRVVGVIDGTIGSYALENGDTHWEASVEYSLENMVVDEELVCYGGTDFSSLDSKERLVAYEHDGGSKRWSITREEDDHPGYLALGPEHVYVEYGNSVAAYGRESGEHQWTYQASGDWPQLYISSSALFVEAGFAPAVVDPATGEQVEAHEAKDVIGATPAGDALVMPAHGRWYVYDGDFVEGGRLTAVEGSTEL